MEKQEKIKQVKEKNELNKRKNIRNEYVHYSLSLTD